ncbi:MAG: hypothetical protein ACRD5J_07740, partial [Nitrososphaeraceae archaeon]
FSTDTVTTDPSPGLTVNVVVGLSNLVIGSLYSTSHRGGYCSVKPEGSVYVTKPVVLFEGVCAFTLEVIKKRHSSIVDADPIRYGLVVWWFTDILFWKDLKRTV